MFLSEFYGIVVSCTELCSYNSYVLWFLVYLGGGGWPLNERDREAYPKLLCVCVCACACIFLKKKKSLQ